MVPNRTGDEQALMRQNGGRTGEEGRAVLAAKVFNWIFFGCMDFLVYNSDGLPLLNASQARLLYLLHVHARRSPCCAAAKALSTLVHGLGISC